MPIGLFFHYELSLEERLTGSVMHFLQLIGRWFFRQISASQLDVNAGIMSVDNEKRRLTCRAAACIAIARLCRQQVLGPIALYVVDIGSAVLL